MKVIEVHPDDLFDREIRGTLSADDRRRLDDHLAHCSPCRLERQLRSDFEFELAPQGEMPSLQSFVSGAMRTARPQEPNTDAGGADAERTDTAAKKNTPSVAPRARTWRRRLVYLLAATMVFGTGIAAAQSTLGRRVWDSAKEEISSMWGPSTLLEESSETMSPTTALALPQVAPPPRDEPKIPSASELPSVPDVAPPTPLATPAPAPAPAPAPRTSPSSTVAARPWPAPPATEPPQALAPTPVPPESASDLFDRANVLRRQGNHEASALYRELQTRFPRSPEARLSIALAARMQLDQGDTASALAGFGRYLATGDTALREEAMEGRAMALQRLGRKAEENEAWRDLLLAYPHSAYAGIARKRLGQDVP